MNNNVRMNMYYIYSFLLTAVILRDRSMRWPDREKTDQSIRPKLGGTPKKQSDEFSCAQLLQELAASLLAADEVERTTLNGMEWNSQNE